ncbi:hypoxanthine phosphoribosyltransferase [Desulfofustis glycolicus]|uniref:Hypoxanthine phosphoribosyltransferase n=1 Tax=Desulfofustis glycolicus DSM 9705 TaxID=1121409 RepID=A0A1M5WIP2_9BACT|nr:hypoxanthine phosphoribosyltransferase [Desulfofustis glycolicus]MCB2216822.1 hypoxanthine phosphoribosyltransferase [Desulfobulbaceae bacterium]SHH87419.1 hypoxanthine phosphoribosyltransferase [Desulfofustis glycolicus DSM 9705]
MEHGIERVLISEQEIEAVVARLGREITAAYQSVEQLDLVVVGLLRGSFMFMADLVRQIKLPMVVDFLTVSSYGAGTVSSGNVKVVMDLDQSIEGKDILMVEDIIDTGHTFNKIIGLIRHRRPRSLKICTFLSKPSRRLVEVPIDFCGLTIPDEFACGYGLDHAQKYRNLPYVGVLEPALIKGQ